MMAIMTRYRDTRNGIHASRAGIQALQATLPPISFGLPS